MPEFRSKAIEFLIVGILLASSSVLILSNLGNVYLWQDEAQTALISETVLAHGIPLGHDTRNSFSQDYGKDYGKNGIWLWHPWLPFYVLAGFFAVFGVSTFMARLPFALFGIGTILLAYYFARDLWGSRRAGVLASVLLMLSAWFLILVRQCRYYSPDAFFVLLGLYAYVSLLQRKKCAGPAFGISAILLFHTHYVHYGILLAVVIIHSAVWHRNRLKTVFVVSALTAIINLPWIIWFSSMGRIIRAAGLDPLRISQFLTLYLTDAIRYVFPPAILLLLPLVWARHKRWIVADTDVRSGMWLLVLFLVIHLLATTLTATQVYFRFLMPMIPVACLIMAAIMHSAMTVRGGVIAVILVALTFCWPMGGYLYEITHHYNGPNEGIARYLNAHARKDDVVAVLGEEMPLKFYTRLRIVGGTTGEKISLTDADWVVIREAGASMEFVKSQRKSSAYQAITLQCPETRVENRECPKFHRFRTPTNVRPVTIFRRVAR